MIYRYGSVLQTLTKSSKVQLLIFHFQIKFRSACRDTAVADLNKDDSLNILINKLETLYVKDKKASAYIAYERFKTYQRPSDMNIADYLNEFERSCHEIQRFEMSFPSAVLAYRVLKSSNLPNEK